VDDAIDIDGHHPDTGIFNYLLLERRYSIEVILGFSDHFREVSYYSCNSHKDDNPYSCLKGDIHIPGIDDHQAEIDKGQDTGEQKALSQVKETCKNDRDIIEVLEDDGVADLKKTYGYADAAKGRCQ